MIRSEIVHKLGIKKLYTAGLGHGHGTMNDQLRMQNFDDAVASEYASMPGCRRREEGGGRREVGGGRREEDEDS